MSELAKSFWEKKVFMGKIKELSDHEKKIIKECLNACVDWFQKYDGNLSTFLGFTKEQIQEIARQWPENESSQETFHAIKNVLLHWLSCPTVDSKAVWKPSIPLRWKLYKIFIKVQDVNKLFLDLYDKKELLEFINTRQPFEYLIFGEQDNQADPNKITNSCLNQSYYCYIHSNFRVNNDLIWYRTAEHYMMAEKARLFCDEGALEALNLETNIAFGSTYQPLYGKVKNFDQTLWQEKIFDIVFAGNEAKFARSIDLKRFLLKTENTVIVYANPNDSLLGIGLPENHPDAKNPHKWRGLNILGFALMKARKKLFDDEIKRMFNAALINAVHTNDVDDAQELLATGLWDNSAYMRYGMGEMEELEKFMTLLHHASNSGQREMISLLLSSGMYVDQRNSSGCTALHYAVWSGHQEIVKLLINAGADINAQGDPCCCMEGYTPLHIAAFWNKGNLEMVQLLLSCQLDMKQKNDSQCE